MKSKKIKKSVAALVLAFLGLKLFAYNGVMSGQKKLKVLNTKWFDIIYAAQNEQTARILAENADRIYENAASELGCKPQCRMPVVITTGVEVFNANWSCVPYNHIVIYDTEPASELLVFSENLLSTFKHEIVHSITFNLKNGFWNGFDKIFGDPVYPGALTVTKGMAEGAAVAAESTGGEGRLNSEYAKHIVKQAKLEGKFPSYWEVQGASEKYPVGKYYYFNGAFHQWLCNKYGMEKYARFWYQLVNFKSVSAEIAFKKIYGIKIAKAWKAFEEEYEVPEVEAAAGFYDEFIGKNKCGAVYLFLKKGGDRIIFGEDKTSAVYSPEGKIFTIEGLQNAGISPDGRFITAIYNSFSAATVKSKMKIYDCEKKAFTLLPVSSLFTKTNIHGAVIVKRGENYFLVCRRYVSPKSVLETYRIRFRKNRICDFEKLSERSFEMNVIPKDLLPLKNGNFAFVKRAGLSCFICECTVEGKVLYEVKLPEERMEVRQLSEYEGKIYFSWTKPGSMPENGMLDFAEQKFELYEESVSGGIFWPVKTEDGFIFVSKFYQQDGIYAAKNGNFSAVKEFDADFCDGDDAAGTMGSGLRPGVGIAESEATGAALQTAPSNELGKAAFLPKYYLRGIFLPVSICSSTSYNKYYVSSYWLPFGVTYISANPWSAGQLTLSAGYGLPTDSFGFQAGYSGGTETSLFKYSVTAFTEFDGDGWKQVRGNAGAASVLPFGNVSRFILSDSAVLHYGRSNLNAGDFNSRVKARGKSEDFINKYKGSAKPKNTTKYFYAYNSVNFTYSNIHQCGTGKYSLGGFSAGVLLSDSYNSENQYFPQKTDYGNKVNAGFKVKVNVPRLLPLKDDLNLTYNLPAEVSVYGACRESEGAYSGKFVQKENGMPEFDGGYADLKVVLFGADVQKGNAVLFFNDLRFVLNYKAGFSYFDEDDVNWRIKYLGRYLRDLGGKVPVEQYAGLQFAAGITPNWGITANYLYEADLYCEFGAGWKNDKVFQQFTVGLNLNL